MQTSKWIFKTTTPLVIIDTRRTVSRPYTYWINTVRLPSPRRTSRKDHRSHRKEEKEKLINPKEKTPPRVRQILSIEEYWNDKTCFKCGKAGHLATHWPNSNDEDDTKSRSSQAKSVKKLKKEVKSMKKAFAQLKETKKDSDISESDSFQGESHFQATGDELQFTQVESELEPRIAQLFKQAHGSNMTLDLREIILVDSQSTMDLICNPNLVKKIFRSSTEMQLKSNGGSMTVKHKAKMAGYPRDVWFDKKAITNILALSNVIKQYRVTYDSDDRMFVVHREAAGKPNMEFRMHESGLHFYDPSDDEFNFVHTVSGNKDGFTQRQIKASELARALYATLSNPYWNDFKWIIRSNQIMDCPVTVQDVENAFKLWGKNVAALKGKTPRSKPHPVTEDLVKVPTELLKLHKNAFLTVDV
jgi:hypothetical protein